MNKLGFWEASIFGLQQLVFIVMDGLFLYLSRSWWLSEWCEWQEWSVTCGSRVQRRSRNCADQSPSVGGSTCLVENIGSAEETQKYSLPDC